MNTLDHLPAPALRTRGQAGRLTLIGIAFAALGAIAILLPAWATVSAELRLASMLALWGAVGLWFAWEMCPARECRYAGVTFGATLLLGLLFLLFPDVGVETLTVAMMMVFLMEGIVSILLGLRTSSHLRNWGWLVFSGLCSLIVCVIVLIGWPETAIGTLGLLLGLNFLSTGVSLVMLGSSAEDLA